MEFNSVYIRQYMELLKSTSLQRSYQEFVKFFRYMRVFFEKQMPDFKFSGGIVENNMDYSYFQCTNEELKTRGLKIVIVFVHQSCDFEVWLSGMNRDIQIHYYKKLTGNANKYKYILTENPSKSDYILKYEIYSGYNFDDPDALLLEMKQRVDCFLADVENI